LPISPLSAGKPIKQHDPNFDAEVEFHEGKVIFVQRLKVQGKPGVRSITGSASYQLCDDHACIPGHESFSLSLVVDPASSIDKSANNKARSHYLGGEIKAVLERLDTLDQRVQSIGFDAKKAHTKLNQQFDQLKASKSKKGRAFDEQLSYHHSWDKGLAAAKKSGKPIFVTFTGHLCTNCRRMENTVLVDPMTINILKGYERIVLHVDNNQDPEEMKNRDRLLELGGLGTIPAYYVLDKSGQKQAVHTGVADSKQFAKFLKEGNPSTDQTWLSFILACIGLGLITLALPCTYPMIPITISVFSKGSQLSRLQSLRRAAAYAAGIIVSYTAIGGIVQIIFGGAGQQKIQDFANNGIINIFIGGIFVYFAFSFFGYYEIAMPAFLRKLMQRGQANVDDSGSVPAWSLFLMGVFFMLTSYSCGAPFVLAVFEQASHNTHPMAIVLALFIFSSTIALPFLLLALVPNLIRSLPRSGGWFTTFKVTLGFLELAFALKFFSTTDLNYNLAILTRPLFLGLCIMLFSLLGFYLLGFFRFPHDQKIETVSMGRLSFAILFFTVAIYLSTWFAGEKLEKNLDALLPPHPYKSMVEEDKQ
ncbi:MAG: cytochrome c biogenesis protein CcdA, partial [Planctomycetota bacterium]|nr:cytochrome c biogenesis protein CcdA [Planctomycetota bacterium]